MELQNLWVGPALKFAGTAAAGGAIDWGTKKTLDKTNDFRKSVFLMNLDAEEPELENLAIPFIAAGAAAAKLGGAAKFAGKAAAGSGIAWGTEKGLDKMNNQRKKNNWFLQDLEAVEPELEELWVGPVVGAIGKGIGEATIDWGTKKSLDKANNFRKTGMFMI